MLAKQIYSTTAILQLEKLAIEKEGIAAFTLMKTAGEAAFQCLMQSCAQLDSIAVFCGSGNNAGDGYVVATLAKQAGIKAICYFLRDPEGLTQPASLAYELAHKAGVTCKAFDDSCDLSQEGFIVDALLGTGFKGDLRSDYASAIECMNKAAKPILAIDIPSGVNANTGEVAEIAVKANHTMSFIGLKQGLVTGDALDYCGELHLDTLGISDATLNKVSAQAELMSLTQLKQMYLQPRQKNSHKGFFGHVAVIGGDHGMAGAVTMAAMAAARVGAGLTTVVTQPEHVTVITTKQPELMTKAVENPTQLASLIQRATILALGPGLGQSVWGQGLFDAVMQLEEALPMVLDADALNLLAKDPLHNDGWVLTPHPKEAAALLGVKPSQVQHDRFAAIKQLHQKFGGVIVLKGAGTLVFDGHDPIQVCDAGNPGMASGGMGDVLAGLIAGLMAQKIPPMAAACLGVNLHGQAGDNCAQKNGMRGMLALDLLPEVRKLIN